MKTVEEAIAERHSVRKYVDRKIEADKIEILNNKIDEINNKEGLMFSLCVEEPMAFKAEKPHYGAFSGCKNYFLLAAKKGMQERVGYYGEELVILSQQLGLNTCWVALTYDKKVVRERIGSDETPYVVIALGYGENQGVAHKNKDIKKVSNISTDSPEWFKKGVETALLAPTAINQQKFKFILEEGNKVKVVNGFGPCIKIDVGIVKYHFEIGAGRENFEWVD